VSGGSYAGGGLDSAFDSLAEVRTNHSDIDLPNGSSILSVELSIEWNVDADDTCSIAVYNGTWNTVHSGCPGTTDQTDTFNISNITTTESLAEDIRVKINYTATTGTLSVDFINVTLTYAPSHPFLSWNLTNLTGDVLDGQEFARNDTLNASAQWTNTLESALLEHNGTGSFANYSILGSFTGNWTNHTLNFSNYTQFPTAGNVTVNAIYATDEFGQENATSPSHFFILWGHADADLSLSSTSALNKSNVSLYCNVTDSNSSAVIINYNASFWKNGSYLGSNITNSSGLAYRLYEDSTSIVNSTSQIFEFKCNITNQADIFYNSSPSNVGASNLSIVDVLEINLTMNETIYNRGENLTIKLLDTSNSSIANVSWNITLTKFNQSSSTVFDSNADNYTFSINVSDPIGNWTLVVNATKDGRETVQTFKFNASSTLTPDFTQPTAETSFSASAAISPRPQVRVLNARSEVLNYSLIGATVFANMTCPNGVFIMELSSGVYQNITNDCLASASSGAAFSLVSVANDSYNNSGTGTLLLSTSAASSGNSGNSGGGGGGGGGATAQNCTCGEWTTNNVCGFGTCDENEILETRVCSPAGCSNESRCVFNPICIEEEEMNFNFTISAEEIQPKQGESEAVIISVSNTGSLPISISFNAEKECCTLSLPEGFELPTKESRSVSLAVQAKLTQETGTYLVTLNMTSNVSTATLTKTQKIKVIVEKNPLIEDVQTLKQQLKELEDIIKELKEAGVDTSALENKKEEISSLILGALSSIDKDSAAELKANVESAKLEIQNAFQTVTNMEFIKLLAENRWYIVSGTIIVIILAYMITQLLVPYYRLGRDIMGLSREEKTLVKARIETEKQYFNRAIDESTFKSVLTEGQGKILRIRGALKAKREVRSSLIKTRASPRAFARWISGWAKKENLRAFKEKLVKRKEAPHDSKGRGVLRNLLHNAGLRESGHPKIRISAKPVKKGSFWQRFRKKKPRDFSPKKRK